MLKNRDCLINSSSSPDEDALNLIYAIELRYEGLKCNKTATYGDEA